MIYESSSHVSVFYMFHMIHDLTCIFTMEIIDIMISMINISLHVIIMLLNYGIKMTWKLPIILTVSSAFDSTISGWADVLHAVHNDIRGCYFYFSFSCFWSYVSYAWLAIRPPSPSPEECWLLQAATNEFGAAMCGTFLICFSYHCSAVLWLTFVLIEPLSFKGHRGTWHTGGSRP